jgi:hypothetical protein
VVPPGNVGENFVINFPRTYFQAQETSMNFLRKSGTLVHFWKRNLVENTVLSEGKLDETGARLENTRQKSVRCLAQESGMPKSSAAIVKKLLKLKP